MRGGNATHVSCKRTRYAQRTGVEGNCPGKVGKEEEAGVEGSREWLTALLGLELLGDLAEDRQRMAGLSPLGTLLLAGALRGGGELAA